MILERLLDIDLSATIQAIGSPDDEVTNVAVSLMVSNHRDS
ncbi:MAG: hypothetical protein J07HX64_02779 [halophilic archaeon J07HX64]|nr:MAG: hypothetical protein J07HX64_02779 [halophilic archaeon J07HX64]